MFTSATIYGNILVDCLDSVIFQVIVVIVGYCRFQVVGAYDIINHVHNKGRVVV